MDWILLGEVERWSCKCFIDSVKEHTHCFRSFDFISVAILCTNRHLFIEQGMELYSQSSWILPLNIYRVQYLFSFTVIYSCLLCFMTYQLIMLKTVVILLLKIVCSCNCWSRNLFIDHIMKSIIFSCRLQGLIC